MFSTSRKPKGGARILHSVFCNLTYSQCGVSQPQISSPKANALSNILSIGYVSEDLIHAFTLQT